MLVYYTSFMTDKMPQLSFEQLFDISYSPEPIKIDRTATRTVLTAKPPEFDTYPATARLLAFRQQYQNLFSIPRRDLYYSFHIPKRSGGLRRIDAPNAPLKVALKELSLILVQTLGERYHTNAYAYITGRTPGMSLVKHQYNKSNWFAKFDFSGFFNSINLDFTIAQLARLYPYNYMFECAQTRDLIAEILELCFLNNGLPQGTPISPMLTNLVMLPIDYELTKKLRPQHVYTRYADDLLISSRAAFDVATIQNHILDTLDHFQAPLVLNTNKTRYLSKSGPNYHLGLILNKDNDITLGHERKHQFKAMIFNLLMDRSKNIHWSLHDLQVLQGYINYYSQIEPNVISDILQKYANRFRCNISTYLKSELSHAS